MKYTWPCRLVFVGGSGSGKTTLVRQMILRGDFNAKKKEIQILVASPVTASLQQPIWGDLKSRGYDISAVSLKGQPLTSARPAGQPKPGKKFLLVIDDIDHINEIKGGRAWLLDLFGVESHHSNMSVVLIAHHLRIGCPAIMASATAVILCSLPSTQVKDICKMLSMTSEEETTIVKALEDPEGAPEDSKGPCQLFNHVVVWRTPLFEVVDGASKKITSLYKMPRKLTPETYKLPTLTPIN